MNLAEPIAPAADNAAGAPDEASGPFRRCIVSRAILPKERLVRFVVGPDGMLAPDIDGRLPGRGLWLQARRDIVETASGKGFAKAARLAVRLPDGLADIIERLLERRCLDALGLARRAGQAAAGYDKVKAWMREGRVAVLAQALDGADGGRTKLVGQGEPRLPLVELFTAAQLGAALGRDHAVHVALARGALARRFLSEATRLAGFRAGGRVTIPEAEGVGTDGPAPE